MKLFSDCSGPCETCANNKPGLNCLAGHGDDHYVEELEMGNSLSQSSRNLSDARYEDDYDDYDYEYYDYEDDDYDDYDHFG